MKQPNLWKMGAFIFSHSLSLGAMW